MTEPSISKLVNIFFIAIFFVLLLIAKTFLLQEHLSYLIYYYPVITTFKASKAGATLNLKVVVVAEVNSISHSTFKGN